MARTDPHHPRYDSPGGFTDSYVCSCGWRSSGFWDAVYAAWDEWLIHAKAEGLSDDTILERARSGGPYVKS